MAAIVARPRLERGVKLNYPEAVAPTDFVLEGARDGRSVADLMEAGESVVAREQVMEGIAEMIPEVQVAATIPDGSKLVTVHGLIPRMSLMSRLDLPDASQTKTSGDSVRRVRQKRAGRGGHRMQVMANAASPLEEGAEHDREQG